MSMLPSRKCPQCDCDCICHRMPGVSHVIACCGHLPYRPGPESSGVAQTPLRLPIGEGRRILDETRRLLDNAPPSVAVDTGAPLPVGILDRELPVETEPEARALLDAMAQFQESTITDEIARRAPDGDALLGATEQALDHKQALTAEQLIAHLQGCPPQARVMFDTEAARFDVHLVPVTSCFDMSDVGLGPMVCLHTDATRDHGPTAAQVDATKRALSLLDEYIRGKPVAEIDPAEWLSSVLRWLVERSPVDYFDRRGWARRFCRAPYAMPARLLRVQRGETGPPDWGSWHKADCLGMRIWEVLGMPPEQRKSNVDKAPPGDGDAQG